MIRHRFAPSPSGPLHFGSLIAAVGSYLQARSQQGEWLLRIEDVDTPRVVSGATQSILHTLVCYGLYWDGEIMYQSQRLDAYQAALDQLRDQGLAYPCTCSRREISQIARLGYSGRIYPGLCRQGPRQPQRSARAIRLQTNNLKLCFEDAVQGLYCQRLETDIGDFVIRRADGIFSYQLAVVVDDAAQGISDIVRGSDLLDSTPRQIYLQQLLGLPNPRYYHLPIIVDTAGFKLSKQTGAAALDDEHPVPALINALQFLGQQPPPSLQRAALSEVWHWALAHWQLERVPKQLNLSTVI